MGLAEDLKALQDLREKGELSETAYISARDAILHKHGVAGKYTFAIVLAVLVFLLGLLLTNKLSKNTLPATIGQLPPTVTTPYVPPQPQPHSIQITNGALTIGAGSLSWYPFVVPPAATTVVVEGHFTATGGMGNDIIAYITDDDGLANLKNGHGARVYFNSQKVTQSAISAVLPNAPGTYYLVFDNRFSLITPKAVAVNATLTYMQ